MIFGLRIAILISLLLSLMFFSGALSPPDPPEEKTEIQITAKKIDSFDLRDSSRTRFGSLEFRGGLILSSKNEHFGGISAMRLQPDGAQFIALSDRASWLLGRIVYDGIRPAAIEQAAMLPVLNFKGKTTRKWDTESLALSGNTLYIGVEGEDIIARYSLRPNGLNTRAEPVSVPSELKELPSNKGLEALVYVPKQLRLGGALIALSERGLDESGNLKAFLIGGPKPGSFSIRRKDEFDISDAALHPAGDLLLLERKFSFLERFQMRIRRIPLSDIHPGAIVDGPAVIEADARHQIDNMEALDVHRTESGEIILTLMSDNNFSPFQRTILLQFALRE